MIVKIPQNMPSNYFWYLYRCLKELQVAGKIDLQYYQPEWQDQFVTRMYVDGRCIWFDVYDDNRCSFRYRDCDPADLILKANYSSELWDNMSPVFIETYNYSNEEWEHKLRPQIRPFIHGRSYYMDCPPDTDVKLRFSTSYPAPVKKVVSWSGTGLEDRVSVERLKFYDLFAGLNTDLKFWLRKHINADYSQEIKQHLTKYSGGQPPGSLEMYYRWLATGEYSLNIPGICLSQPFRLVDSVLINRLCISSKIWQDAYKDFPCIELPYCAYFGTGDLEKTKIILGNLDKVCYNDLLSKANEWYNQKLTSHNMWKNQIERHL